MLVGAGLSLSPAFAFVDSDPLYDVNIPSRPFRDALVDLAMQTNASIGGIDPAKCGARSAPVQGRMRAGRALRLMLTGSRCDMRRFNARTFRLELVAAPPSKTATPNVAKGAPQEGAEVTILVVRRPQTVSSMPSALSVVSDNVLGESDFDLTNLAARVPGMLVTNLGAGRDKLLLRGVSDSVLTGRTQSTVGLYLDDSPITYNAPDPDLLLVDMARVEVLKGPQGALYGQGSLSGVVRLVTNKPRADLYESDLTAGVGFTEGGHVSSRATAMVNLPLLSNRIGLRTVFYQDTSGGFIDNPGLGPNATNSTTRTGGRIGVLWPIDGHQSLTGTAVFQHIDSENSQYVLSQTGPYKRSLNVAEPHNNSFEDLALDFQGDYEAGTIKASVNHLRHTLSSGYDAQPVTRFATIPTSGILFYDEDQSMALSTGEVSFLSPSSRRLRWLVGLFAAQSLEHFDPHLMDIYSKATLYNEARVDRVRDMAVFGQLNYDFTPKWTASLGLRGTRTSHTTFSQIDNVHLRGYDPAGEIRGKITESHLAHSLLLSYQAKDSLLFYAQTADGFRTGGFNTTTQIVTAVPAQYASDALSSSEIGMRYNTPDNRIRINLTGFQVEWRDIQSDQLRATGLPITTNIGDGANTGVEFEADWLATQRLTLHMAAQLNDPRLKRPNPLFSKDKDGGMPFIARRSVSLSADWNQRLGRHRLENSMTLSYRSPSPLNYGPLRAVQVDSYANLDMSSFVNFGNIRIGARLNNVTGIKSNSFAYGNPFSLEGSSQITPLRPRTLWLSIGRRY